MTPEEYEELSRLVAEQSQSTRLGQQMTHTTSGDPSARGPVNINMLGKDFHLFDAPARSASGIGTTLQTLYDFKTLPFYAFPPTAPFAAAADIAEGAVRGDPLQMATSVLGLPGRIAAPVVAAAASMPRDAQTANAKPFYSALRSAVDGLGRKTGTGDEWMSTIYTPATPASKGKRAARDPATNRPTGEFEYFDVPAQPARAMPGVKPEEIDYSRVADFLRDKPRVTKDELLEYLTAHEQNFMPTDTIAHGNTKVWTKAELERLARKGDDDGADYSEYDRAKAEYDAQQLNPPEVNWVRNIAKIDADIDRVTEEALRAAGKNPDETLSAQQWDEIWKRNPELKERDRQLHLERNRVRRGGDANWQSMSLPGGTNYKEFSLQMPVPRSPEMRARFTRRAQIDKRMAEIYDEVKATGGDPWADQRSLSAYPKLQKEYDDLQIEMNSIGGYDAYGAHQIGNLEKHGWTPELQKEYVDIARQAPQNPDVALRRVQLQVRLDEARRAAAKDKPDVYADRHSFPDNTIAQMRVDDRVSANYTPGQVMDAESRMLEFLNQREHGLKVERGWIDALPEGWTYQAGRNDVRLIDPQGNWTGSRTLQSWEGDDEARKKAVGLYNKNALGLDEPSTWSIRNVRNWELDAAVKSGTITPVEAAQIAHFRDIDNFDTKPAQMRTFNIMEMQSGWHQDGRRTGYKGDKNDKSLTDAEVARVRDLDARVRRREIRMDSPEGQEYLDLWRRHDSRVSGSKVPDAPLKNNWHEMAFRRMVKHAADNGYGRVSWPATPEQVARIEGWDEFYKDGDKFFNGAGNDNDTNVTSIVNRYLQDLPRYAGQIAKKFGAKVEQIEMKVPASGEDDAVFGARRVEGGNQQFNALTLSPALREEAKKRGMPFFNVGAGAAGTAAATRDRQPEPQSEDTSKVKNARGGRINHIQRAQLARLAHNG